MSKVQAIRITELEEQLCRALSAGLKQQAEIARLTAAVETWRVEAVYQANVSESMDRTIAYEAELKADRDFWRKLCQDGWVEVADGPVSSKLRDDLASFMLSRSFATGHGDSHADLLGELGPQIDALRERLETALRNVERWKNSFEGAKSAYEGKIQEFARETLRAGHLSRVLNEGIGLMCADHHPGAWSRDCPRCAWVQRAADALDAAIDAARGGA